MTDLFPERIRTERLVATPPGEADPHSLYDSFWSDPGEAAFEHVPQDPHDSPRETVDWVNGSVEAFAAGEAANYVVRPDDDAAAVGVAVCSPNWDRRLAFVGVLLARRVWGRGYAGELLDALVGLAFDRLDLELVVVEHQAGNERSRRAIEKYVEAHGGREDGHIRNRVPMDDGVDDAHRFTVTREEYEGGVDAA